MSHRATKKPDRRFDLPITLVGWPIIVGLFGFWLISSLPAATDDAGWAALGSRGVVAVPLIAILLVGGIPSLSIGLLLLIIRLKEAHGKD